MVANYARNMPHVATYWPPATPNQFARRGASVARTLACRWQVETNMVRAQGSEHQTEAIVYTAEPIELGGFLALGDFTAGADSDGLLDPAEVPEAKEIRRIKIATDLRDEEQLSKAWL